jgi:2-aminoadipate transaminase
VVAPRFNFDRYDELYAERTYSMVSSEIRDLLSVTARPDIISLAGGLPNTQVMSAEMMSELAARVFAEDGPGALQYGPTDGFAPLKHVICAIMEEEGLRAYPEEVIITHGSQQALEMLSKIFINPGDTIIVEAPSYVGALNSFMSYQPDFITIDMDEDGMRLDLLDSALEGLRRDGRRAKFLYTVPSFQNPAGITLSLDRRVGLLELARRHDLVIIEDNPYGLLRYEGEMLPPLKMLDPERVIYLGTLSKICSAGLRIGWVCAPGPVVEKVLLAKQSADLCTGTLAQRIAHIYFTTQDWRAVISQLVNIYRGRRDALLKAMEELFPEEASWTHPQGGFFVWARVPPYINTKDMLAKAIDSKVAYVPGTGFYPGTGGTSEMRLNFSYPAEEEIHEGIKRLAKVMKREISLARSLGLDKQGPSGGGS